MSSKFSEWYNASKPPKAYGIYEIQQDPKSDNSLAVWEGKKWKNVDGTSITPKKWRGIVGTFFTCPIPRESIENKPSIKKKAYEASFFSKWVALSTISYYEDDVEVLIKVDDASWVDWVGQNKKLVNKLNRLIFMFCFSSVCLFISVYFRSCLLPNFLHSYLNFL